MDDVTDVPQIDAREPAVEDGIPAIDESRLAMMRRIKRLPVAERLALLDRMCREQTRIAIGTNRLR
ncbi:MAG TPA: hypothetical protein VFD31_12490 [Thermoleophilaceae bacterium]|nr:hypothetical protein [Thermoleophilaceae bacterium]